MSVLRIKDFLKTNITGFGLAAFVVLTVLIMSEEAGEVYKYWTNLIGPTIYVLFPMGAVLVGIIFLIAIGRMDGRFPFSVTVLQLIEEGAPVVGLLGTVVALVRGFGQLDLTQSVDVSIKAVIGIINESLFSTAIGLSIGLLSWFIRRGVVPKHLLDEAHGMERSTVKEQPSRKDFNGDGNKTNKICKGNIILPLLAILTVLSLFSISHADESTFEIERYSPVVSVEPVETMMITLLNKQEKRYLAEVLALSRKLNNSSLDKRKAVKLNYIRDRHLNFLLRIEEIKGQIWYRGAEGSEYIYPGQLQGIRRILYILILNDDGLLADSLKDTHENRIFSLRYSTVILTSDNILKMSLPVTGRYVKEYIPLEAEKMFMKLIKDRDNLSLNEVYQDGRPLKTNLNNGGQNVSYTPGIL